MFDCGAVTDSGTWGSAASGYLYASCFETRGLCTTNGTVGCTAKSISTQHCDCVCTWLLDDTRDNMFSATPSYFILFRLDRWQHTTHNCQTQAATICTTCTPLPPSSSASSAPSTWIATAPIFGQRIAEGEPRTSPAEDPSEFCALVLYAFDCSARELLADRGRSTVYTQADNHNIHSQNEHHKVSEEVLLREPPHRLSEDLSEEPSEEFSSLWARSNHMQTAHGQWHTLFVTLDNMSCATFLYRACFFGWF